MSNKDLIREIQNEAVDGNFDLSTILRKCLVLASRLDHVPLKHWAQSELDGKSSLWPSNRRRTVYRRNQKPSAAQVTQVLYQTMYGPVSNVGAADRISQTMIVCPADLRALKFHLRENGFQGPDLEELEKAIKADETGPKLTEHHFGRNVADWLATIVRKAANGALKIGADVAVTVATKALGSYYSIG